MFFQNLHLHYKHRNWRENVLCESKEVCSGSRSKVLVDPVANEKKGTAGECQSCYLHEDLPPTETREEICVQSFGRFCFEKRGKLFLFPFFLCKAIEFFFFFESIFLIEGLPFALVFLFGDTL